MENQKIHIQRKPGVTKPEQKFSPIGCTVNLAILIAIIIFFGNWFREIVQSYVPGMDDPVSGYIQFVSAFIAYSLGLIPATFLMIAARKLLLEEKQDSFAHIDITWDDSLNRKLTAFETKRQKLSFFFYCVTALISVVIIFILYNVYMVSLTLEAPANHIVPVMAVVFMLLLGGFILITAKNLIFKNYQQKYRKELVPEIINMIIPDIRYDPSRMIEQEEFNKSEIVSALGGQTSLPVSYSGKDYCEGEIDNRPVRFSNLKVIRRSRGTSQSAQSTVVFTGLFAIADFQRETSGKTLLYPDLAERSFGKLVGTFLQEKAAALLSKEYKIVQLENPDFEHFISVYSTDQIEARYILTTSLMERINEFYRDIPDERSLSIAIHSGKLFIAIHDHTGSGDFIDAPMLKGKCTDPAYFKELVLDLYLIKDLFKAIYHNTGLWEHS